MLLSASHMSFNKGLIQEIFAFYTMCYQYFLCVREWYHILMANAAGQYSPFKLTNPKTSEGAGDIFLLPPLQQHVHSSLHKMKGAVLIINYKFAKL